MILHASTRFLSGCLIFGLLNTAPIALSQVSSDGSTSTSIIPQNNHFLIQGGSSDGHNLFHSFSQFSVPTGAEAIFHNDIEGIVNVISRVTGNSASWIDGTVKTQGLSPNFNLFLINPNGITFGANAAINVQGAFLASTADAVVFDNGSQFSAVTGQTPSLMRINVPIGLQMGRSPGAIALRGNGSDPLNSEDPQNTHFEMVTKGIALIGGDIQISGGGSFLFPEKSHVTLGGLSEAGLLNFSQVGDDLNFALPVGLRRSNISITDQSVLLGASLDEKEPYTVGVSFDLFAKNLSIIGETADNPLASISTGVFSEGGNGRITVDATEEIVLKDSFIAVSVPRFQLKGISQRGGDTTIRAENLYLSRAEIRSSLGGRGQSGNIFLQIRKDIILDNFSTTFTSVLPISNQLDPVTQENRGGRGLAGDIDIRARSLTIAEGSFISSSLDPSRPPSITSSGEIINFEEGAIGLGGKITIHTTERVSVFGINPIIGFSSQIATRSGQGASGPSGNIEITTPFLEVSDGAVLTASTANDDNGGRIQINANAVNITGGGQIITSSLGSGAAGDIILNLSGDLSISGKGPSIQQRVNNFPGITEFEDLAIPNVSEFSGLFANAQGTSDGGNLTLSARSIFLNDFARLTTASESGQGGNIGIDFRDILSLQNHSSITAEAGTESGGGGNGGNITISGGFILADPAGNSDIDANAFVGAGGNIQLNTLGIFGIQPRPEQTPLSDITASSDIGLDGEILINRLDADPESGLTQLPDNILVAEDRVVQQCGRGGKLTRSRFFITGRGGLPINPTIGVDSPSSLSELGYPNTALELSDPPTTATSSNSSPSSDEIEAHADTLIEARGWKRDQSGKIVLVSQQIATKSPTSGLQPNFCYGNPLL